MLRMISQSFRLGLRCNLLSQKDRKCRARLACRYLLFSFICYTSLCLVTSSGFYRSTPTNKISVVFQSRGEYGRWALDKLLRRSFPGYEIVYVDPDKVDLEHDLVLEGPPLFQSEAPCRYRDKPWIQFSSEPRSHYKESEWCGHKHPPILRLDTSKQPFRDRASTHVLTTPLLWTPYVCQYAIDFRNFLKGRSLVDFEHRPFNIAWLSSNCVERRVNMWRAVVRVAAQTGVEGVHSLGACEHSHEAPRGREALYENKYIYESYRMVLVMENSIEEGYVTEKLAQALAAGTIPVYFGHHQSVRAIFNSSSFIDIEDVWRTVNGRSSEPSTDEEWDRVAAFVLQVAKNSSLSRDYLLKNVFSLHKPWLSRKLLQPFPPECIGFEGRELERAYEASSIQRAVGTLRAELLPHL